MDCGHSGPVSNVKPFTKTLVSIVETTKLVAGSGSKSIILESKSAIFEFKSAINMSI